MRRIQDRTITGQDVQDDNTKLARVGLKTRVNPGDTRREVLGKVLTEVNRKHPASVLDKLLTPRGE